MVHSRHSAYSLLPVRPEGQFRPPHRGGGEARCEGPTRADRQRVAVPRLHRRGRAGRHEVACRGSDAAAGRQELHRRRAERHFRARRGGGGEGRRAASGVGANVRYGWKADSASIELPQTGGAIRALLNDGRLLTISLRLRLMVLQQPAAKEFSSPLGSSGSEMLGSSAANPRGFQKRLNPLYSRCLRFGGRGR